MHKKRFCPFAGCTQHAKSDKPCGWDTTESSRDHFMTLHRDHLHRLTPEQEMEHEVYTCRHCEQFVASSPKKLEEHITKHHVVKRTRTNFDIVSKILYNDVKCVHSNHWHAGLSFLQSHKFDPPTFRQTLISNIRVNTRLEESILKAFYDTILCCVAAHGEVQYIRGRRHCDFDATPIWLLPFIFERLILAPNPDIDKDDTVGINTIIHRRIRLFRLGQIETLYNESNRVTSRTPAEHRDNPVKIQRCAQISADNDDYKTANTRLTKDMPVAAIDDSNIQILHDLHPHSLNLDLHKPTRTTRGSIRNRKKIIISPNAMLQIFSHLKRGKACGFELDSLDIFIKLAGAYRRSKRIFKPCRLSLSMEIIARFFTIIANGEIPQDTKSILRTTYLVALHKSTTDKRTLRPLGVPSAIRRIAAIAVLQMYKGRFAKYLLPFNYAFGVQGGVDFITTTLRLGIEKFMTKYEATNKTPSRTLISLDISNMFNAVSRQKALQIISREFPELEPFAECLYEDFGTTQVKRSDGTWESIQVEEGFSQGCPASPIFAALVLTHILTKINRTLSQLALKRLTAGNLLDDGQGGKPLILGYVDDVNILLPTEDVEQFFLLFRLHGQGIEQQTFIENDELITRDVKVNPGLGAVLNTEKTRIMTTTTNKSVVDRLLASPSEHDQLTGASLKRAISAFSTDKGEPYEEINGLRVLGAPIGSPAFCSDFILNMVRQTVEASNKIINGLDSDQTILQLFCMCTAHKLTHLFAADVLTKDFDDLPDNWNLYDSDMAADFNGMIDGVLSSITRRDSVPDHALLISTMATQAGGLGIPHPRSTTIPAFMLNLKRSLQYVHEGVWIGCTDPLVTLPCTITDLYSDWQTTNQALTFRVFRKYLEPIAHICVSEQVDDRIGFFLSKSSTNTCRERLRLAAASRIKIILESVLEDDMPSLIQLEDILEPKTSYSLLDIGRTLIKNRRPNDDFTTMLKRKLRLELWPECLAPVCACGQKMDLFGDHCLSCRSHCKTPLHNLVRDGLWDLFKELFHTVKLTSSDKNVVMERLGVVKALPQTRPFDISVLFDHMLDERAWKTPLTELGFDVTFISSKPSFSTRTTAARKKEIYLRLRDGEKKKFTRRGKNR